MIRVLDMYEKLFAAYGPQNWWPGETPFEVMVGAVLVQNTAWRNVERAIQTLKEESLLAPHELYDLPVEELEQRIRPAGYYRIKARRLRNLLALVVETYGGCVASMCKADPAHLREQLLAVNGIGPETADSILLYAAGLPFFVVDAYSHRVLSRHGLIDGRANYDQMQTLFHTQLPKDVALYNEFHALLVRVGKEKCAKRTPKCGDCPLDCLFAAAGANHRERRPAKRA